MGKASQEELQSLVNHVNEGIVQPPLTVKHANGQNALVGIMRSSVESAKTGGPQGHGGLLMNRGAFNQISDSQLLTMRDEPIGHDLALETVSSIKNPNLQASPSIH